MMEKPFVAKAPCALLGWGALLRLPTPSWGRGALQCDRDCDCKLLSCEKAVGFLTICRVFYL